MRSRAWQIIELSLAAASVLIQSTVAFAAENPGGTAAPKELVSAWLRTRTNEWVRYHYPLVRLPVYQAGRLVQPAVTLKGWYETNHSPPVVERKIVSTRPPPPPPNLDDPKSLREYVIRHGRKLSSCPMRRAAAGVDGPELGDSLSPCYAPRARM